MKYIFYVSGEEQSRTPQIAEDGELIGRSNVARKYLYINPATKKFYLHDAVGGQVPDGFHVESGDWHDLFAMHNRWDANAMCKLMAEEYDITLEKEKVFD